MDPTKAPGPDDLYAIFYQKKWDVVEKDVCDMTLSFLNSQEILDSINHTRIVLILKVNNPLNMIQFVQCDL